MGNGERVQVSMRLPRPLYRRIRVAAAEHETSINAYLTTLLEGAHGHADRSQGADESRRRLDESG